MAGRGSKPGERRGGRQKGTPNKLTKSVKEAFEVAFHAMQDKPGVKLSEWGEENPTEFYKLAARLIPTELSGSVNLQETAVDLLRKRAGS